MGFCLAGWGFPYGRSQYFSWVDSPGWVGYEFVGDGALGRFLVDRTARTRGFYGLRSVVRDAAFEYLDECVRRDVDMLEDAEGAKMGIGNGERVDSDPESDSDSEKKLGEEG